MSQKGRRLGVLGVVLFSSALVFVSGQNEVLADSVEPEVVSTVELEDAPNQIHSQNLSGGG